MTIEEVENLFTYHAPTPEQVTRLGTLRAWAQGFAATIVVYTPAGPDQSAAIRKLRECLMTANAAIILETPDEQQIETLQANLAATVLHDIEAPFKVLVKAERVLATAIQDQPELKTVLTALVQKMLAVEVAAGAAVAGEGTNIVLDAAALTQVEAIFSYFYSTVVPEVEKVYGEIKTDVETTTVTEPATASAS